MNDENNYKNVLFHADDYGVTLEQSKKILSCHTQGALNSISVIPNSPAVRESLQLLDELDPDKKIRRVLHLNFVEGKPLADLRKVSLLVDKEGYFDKSFVQLLKWNLTKKGAEREKLKGQLKAEITAQLDMVTMENNYHISAVDAHQHYHMIPVVLEALLEVLKEKKVQNPEVCIREIRIPVDPLGPWFHARDIWHKTPWINFVKWGILRCFERKTRKRLTQEKIDSPVFFGILFTCEMKWDIVQELLPKYISVAEKKQKKLELMFHPGNLEATYELLDSRSKELAEFYMSENRFQEAECLRQLALRK